MTRKNLSPILLVLLTLTVAITGCSNDTTTPPPVAFDQGMDKVEGLGEALDQPVTGYPNATEIADLKFLREEEKLAHDVYVVLYDQYDMQIFYNISLSEQKHTDSVKNLLDKYGLEDPVGENGLGEFTNHELQELYDGLIDSGLQSVTEALLVGLAIEEIDILDLHHVTDRAVLPDIIKVYGNLCDGSENHLRAFVSNYESYTGEIYEPRWLTQEEYDTILSEDNDQGGNGNNGNGRVQ